MNRLSCWIVCFGTVPLAFGEVPTKITKPPVRSSIPGIWEYRAPADRSPTVSAQSTPAVELRETDVPTFTAGRIPLWKRSDSKNICPSVMEMTFVGMYAAISPACVSMMGKAVSDPPPNFSSKHTARSRRRECR